MEISCSKLIFIVHYYLYNSKERMNLMHVNRIFIPLFLAIFVAMLGIGIIAPIMPLYVESLGANGFELGLIYAAFSISRAVFMPIMGKLSDQKGRKRFILIGLAIYASVSLGYIGAGSVMTMTWIRLLHGMGSAMVIPIATAVIGDISPKGREGRMMGNFQVALFLGFGAGPLLGGLIQDLFEISQVFYFMGSLSFIALIMVAIWVPETESHLKHQKEKTPQSISVFRHPKFRGLLAFRFSNAVGRASVIAFLPVFASHLNLPASKIGILISINILLTSLLQYIFGKVADRFDRRILIIAGNIIGAVPLLLTPFAQSFSHLALLGCLMGLGGGLAFPAAGAVATELGRGYGMGHVMGNFNMAMSIGSIVGAMSAGQVMDLFGMSYVFIFGGIVTLVGSAACLVWLYQRNYV